MARQRPSAEWYKWCIEVGELVEQRDKLRDHPHSLGEKWEAGMLRDYDERIAALRASEPPKYPAAH